MELYVVSQDQAAASYLNRPIVHFIVPCSLSRQQRQFGIDIGAYPIPAQQCIHGEAVTSVMDPWQLSFGGQDAALSKKRPQTHLQPRPIVCPSTLDRVPNESDVCRYRKPMPFSGAQVTLNFTRDVAVDRKQARLVELGLSNKQGRVLAVVIAQSETEQFPAPDSSCEQENNRKPNTSGRIGEEGGRVKLEAARSSRATSVSEKMYGMSCWWR